jgi:hypothetical protein
MTTLCHATRLLSSYLLDTTLGFHSLLVANSSIALNCRGFEV